MKIDFNSAPSGSTHWDLCASGVVWFRVAKEPSGPPCFIYSEIGNPGWVAMSSIIPGLKPVPNNNAIARLDAWLAYANEQRMQNGNRFTAQEALIRGEVSMQAFYAGWDARCGY